LPFIYYGIKNQTILLNGSSSNNFNDLCSRNQKTNFFSIHDIEELEISGELKSERIPIDRLIDLLGISKKKFELYEILRKLDYLVMKQEIAFENMILFVQKIVFRLEEIKFNPELRDEVLTPYIYSVLKNILIKANKYMEIRYSAGCANHDLVVSKQENNNNSNNSNISSNNNLCSSLFPKNENFILAEANNELVDETNMNFNFDYKNNFTNNMKKANPFKSGELYGNSTAANNNFIDNTQSTASLNEGIDNISSTFPPSNCFDNLNFLKNHKGKFFKNKNSNYYNNHNYNYNEKNSFNLFKKNEDVKGFKEVILKSFFLAMKNIEFQTNLNLSDNRNLNIFNESSLRKRNSLNYDCFFNWNKKKIRASISYLATLLEDFISISYNKQGNNVSLKVNLKENENANISSNNNNNNINGSMLESSDYPVTCLINQNSLSVFLNNLYFIISHGSNFYDNADLVMNILSIQLKIIRVKEFACFKKVMFENMLTDEIFLNVSNNFKNNIAIQTNLYHLSSVYYAFMNVNFPEICKVFVILFIKLCKKI